MLDFSIALTSLAYSLGWYSTPVMSLMITMAAPTLRRSGGSPGSDRVRVGTTASYPPPDARAPGWGRGGREGGQVQINTLRGTSPLPYARAPGSVTAGQVRAGGRTLVVWRVVKCRDGGCMGNTGTGCHRAHTQSQNTSLLPFKPMYGTDAARAEVYLARYASMPCVQDEGRRTKGCEHAEHTPSAPACM